MRNYIEIVGKTKDDKIECAIRSEGERDTHGVIEDPYAHIMAVATQMGYTLTVQDTSSTAPLGNQGASDQQPADVQRPAASPYPKSPPAIEGTEETDQL